MNTIDLKVKITTTEPVLGLSSSNPDIQEEFIASKAPTPAKSTEEIAAIDVTAEIQKATTVFPRDEFGLFWWDYQMRGAFKGWLLALIELGDCKLSKWTYKRSVDLFLHVTPRRIYIRDANGVIYPEAAGKVQRPLRAETMQGDRIALASSEMLPAGSAWEFNVRLLTGSNTKTKVAILREEDIRNCLEMGVYSGFGQWRGSGMGRFKYELTKRSDAEKIRADARRSCTGANCDERE